MTYLQVASPALHPEVIPCALQQLVRGRGSWHCCLRGVWGQHQQEKGDHLQEVVISEVGGGAFARTDPL